MGINAQGEGGVRLDVVASVDVVEVLVEIH